MIKVITTGKLPIKCWLNDIEEGALEQANNLANLPFVHSHVALMADCHLGYGMPIGGVLATKGVVIPNAVGVDIGCGVQAVNTGVKDISREKLQEIVHRISSKVPVGFSHHKIKAINDALFKKAPIVPVVKSELEASKYQLCTLGGGNHFNELQKDSSGFIWIMIHSGSRNFGLKIAKEYHEVAVKMCGKYYSNIPTPDLSFLLLDSQEGHEYMAAMNFACLFAEANRDAIMKASLTAFEEADTGIDVETVILNTLDVKHNYARLEHHFGKNVLVHRKGATSAKMGELGIIPGSQGTKSYIVEGLGNPLSFESCSHGAGRKMGRKEAQRVLNLQDEIDNMESKGILHSIKTITDLDEAAGAYKDIDEVMRNQKDLVKIITELSPVAVIKG